MKGIYLKSPYSTLIVEDKKTLLIKDKQISKDYLDQEIYLCQDDLALGLIKLNNEKLVLLDEFDKLRGHHQISDDERKTLFADANSFFSYEVVVIEKFNPVKKLMGQTQDFMKEITTTDDIDHLEVLYASDILDKIQNASEYNAEKVTDEALHDDARIAAAWYATAINPDKKIKFTKEQIEELAVKIYKEIAKRKKDKPKEFKYTISPENMSNAAKKLWEKVKDKLSKEETDLLLAEEKKKEFVDLEESEIQKLSNDELTELFKEAKNVYLSLLKI